MHPKTSRGPQAEANGTNLRRDSLPYLQPKAELEDEQRRRHELHGERIVRELDGEDKIFQMPDETGRQRIYEMLETDHVSRETTLSGRHEVMGDEHAQELECPTRENEESVRVECGQEHDSSVRVKDEPLLSKPTQELESPVQAKGVCRSERRPGPCRSI